MLQAKNKTSEEQLILEKEIHDAKTKNTSVQSPKADENVASKIKKKDKLIFIEEETKKLVENLTKKPKIFSKF